MSSLNEYACQELANAIVARAAEDYRNALKGIGYDKKSPEKVIKEVEKFFHSHYFKTLTRADGDYLIEKLRQEHDENERSNHESNISASDI